MKALLAACALALAVPLAGCGVPAVHSASTTLAKAVIAADSAYLLAYQAGRLRLQAGQLTLDEFRAAEHKAYEGVLLVRAAHTVADAVEAQQRIDAAAAILNPKG